MFYVYQGHLSIHEIDVPKSEFCSIKYEMKDRTYQFSSANTDARPAFFYKSWNENRHSGYIFISSFNFWSALVMASLVADYGTSDSESDDESESDDAVDE